MAPRKEKQGENRTKATHKKHGESTKDSKKIRDAAINKIK